jgi:predicted lipid-binding transport protein (Tim44 family)
MITLFLFIAVTVFFLSVLNDILGTRQGFMRESEEEKKFSEDAGYVEEVQSKEKDISEVEEQIRNFSYSCRNFDSKNFTDKAKQAFQIVFDAYSACDKNTLKKLLAPKLYNAFVMATDDRISRKETLEGMLLGFSSADIIDAYIIDNEIFITVKFVTKQSNVLKSETGEILEGNSEFVETRTDIWIFYRKKSSEDPRWFVYEIKDLENG